MNHQINDRVMFSSGGKIHFGQVSAVNNTQGTILVMVPSNKPKVPDTSYRIPMNFAIKAAKKSV